MYGLVGSPAGQRTCRYSPGTAALLDAVFCRGTASEEKNREELFTASVVIVQTLGVIGPANTLPAIDFAGLESRNVWTRS